MPTRRDALYGLGTALGSVAFSALLADDRRAGDTPLSPKKPHAPAKAGACIALMVEGGPSHIDTSDPKPKLDGLPLKEFTRADKMQSAMSGGKRYYVASPFKFAKAGKSGADVAASGEYLAKVAADLCFYRGCQVDSVNHPTAMYQTNTGNRFGGDPAVGSRVTYGLGSENRNPPGFVVRPEVSHPQGGAANWSNGFLPADFQGTPLRAKGAPILDLLAAPNQYHAADRPGRDDLAARMESYELAFRMQAEVPGLLDLSKEDKKTRALCGVGAEPTDAFGRRCLLARRLVQRGVRLVRLYAGTWDSHDYIEKARGNLVKQVDKPIAGLIADLKRAGSLDSTLAVWCEEFGRSPDNGVRMGTAFGRGHTPKGMTVWFAGGGVKTGRTVGATDETGAGAVECVHHVRDLHVTILKLMGLDDAKLTYFHGGRFEQLSQFGGQVIKELIA